MAATAAQLAGFDAARTSSGGHVREHTSVLAAAEKRLLVWLAHRLPRWVGSDHLTALGALAMIATALAFAAASLDLRFLLAVPVCLAINWFGDSLDGTVARVRNQQRPRYGFYVDHVVDIANTVVLFTGLAFSGLCSPWIAVALMVGYLLLSGEAFLATHTSVSSGSPSAEWDPPSCASCSPSERSPPSITCGCGRSGSARSGSSTSAASSAPPG